MQDTSAARSNGDRPEVRIPQGVVVGTSEGGVERFSGLPYARPPVGPRRFRAPDRAEAWDGVRDAGEFGPIVPQSHGPLHYGASEQPQSEARCLTVNVWRPAGASLEASLPVMVWIHGGSLTHGSSSWEKYSGSSFARDGVIFVGVNYRLHALGFANLGAVTGESSTSNLGLRDVTLALEWVRESIAAFGGDASNVTVFGQSAGAALASALLAYRPAAGLFARVIMQSGTAVVLQPRETAAAIAQNALAAWGVDPRDRDALERLPIDAVIASADAELMRGTSNPGGFPWMLSRDPDGLDLDVLEAIEAGRAAGIALVLGWTVDEYRLRWLHGEPVGPAVDLDRVPLSFAERAFEVYRPRMPTASDDEVIEKIVNDQHFLEPAVRVAQAHARRGGDARLYEFRWCSPVHDGRLGACHSLEIPFVFDLPASPGFHGAYDLTADMGRLMHGAWLSFAAGQVPVIAEREWPACRPDRSPFVAFDTVTSIDEAESSGVRALWNDAAPDWIGIA